MWDSVPTDDKKSIGSRNILLQKDTKNNLDIGCKQQGRFKENTDRKNTATGKYMWNFFRKMPRNEGLEKLTLTGHIESRLDTGRQLATYLVIGG